MEGLTALIPARGGSKSIPTKNIYNLAGYPMLAYSIAACKKTSGIGHIVVSTDDEEIAEVARQFGATVPFVRPKEFATDDATDLDVIKHFFSAEGPQDIAFVRPTTPLRDQKLMESIIECFYAKRAQISGLRTAHELPESPYKFLKIAEGYFTGFFDDYEGNKDYTNLPRQVFPKAYLPNGFLDIVKKETIATGSDFGFKVLPFITDYLTEADLPYQIKLLERRLDTEGHILLDYLNEENTNKK